MDSNFLSTLKTEKDNLIISRSSEISTGGITQILENLKTEFELPSIDHAKAVAAVLFQQGGTARSCDGNMAITIFQKEIKLARLRKVIKDSGFTRGERKFARSIATDIYNICYNLDMPGNLYHKIKRQFPEREFSLQERVWLSDFQSLNEDAPAELRTLMINSFKKPINPPTLKQTGK